MGTIRVVPIRTILCAHGYKSNCTYGYNSSCTHGYRAQGARRDALASHAVSVYTRFSQAHSVFILAVGAEALSMTPSGDALFAS